jgi:uncharacterized protein
VSNPPSLARDLRPRSIVEPIHGLVRLTEDELHVIDHPLFRRLRKIKQNALLYLVFPSATHNRFEHSLGALFVADSMLEQIWLNSAVSREKNALEPLSTNRTNIAIDFSGVPTELMSWIVRVTRLAALVHDLGHGPLSHTFDSFAPLRDDLHALLNSGVVPSLSSAASALTGWEKTGSPGSVKYDRVPHEVMSCVFFAHVWQKVCGKRYAPTGEETAAEGQFSIIQQAGDSGEARAIPLAVAAAILGEPSITGNVLSAQQKAWLPFIHDLIASAPADADRMDYLERDSRSLGVTYGLFDRNRILKSFLAFKQGEGTNVKYRLGVKRSGISALENLVQARFELFAQIYYHKTNQAVSLMLGEIARGAEKAKVQLFEIDQSAPAKSFDRITRRYEELSDDQFMRALRGLDPDVPGVPDDVKRLAEMVERRELWKRLYEGDEDGAAWLAAKLKSQESDPRVQSGIFQDVSKPKATKDLEKGATLLRRGADGLYAPVFDRGWYRSSIIIEALRRAEGNIGRVYAKGAALEEPVFKRLKASAMRLAHEYEARRELKAERRRKLEEEARREIDRQLTLEGGEDE